MDDSVKNSESLLVEVEREIAELLLDKLEHLDITPERASQIAKFVLHALPDGLTDDRVKEIIPSLDDKFFELADVIYKHIAEYDEKYRQSVLEEVSQLVEHKHFDQANDLMKKYFENKLSN